MKRTIFTFLMVLSGSMVMRCEEPLPNEFGGTIVNIKFGRDWDSANERLLNIGTNFPDGVDKVYYEIKFQGASTMRCMVKKRWRLPFAQSLESVTFMPKDS